MGPIFVLCVYFGREILNIYYILKGVVCRNVYFWYYIAVLQSTATHTEYVLLHMFFFVTFLILKVCLVDFTIFYSDYENWPQNPKENKIK